MKMVTRLMVGLIVPIGLSACLSTAPPTPEELASADYGASISQPEAQLLVITFFAHYPFPDPSSTRYEWWDKVKKGWIGKALQEGGGFEYGYMMGLRVNTKNTFGGYTGFKPYAFRFRDGVIESVYGEVQDSLGGHTRKIYSRPQGQPPAPIVSKGDCKVFIFSEETSAFVTPYTGSCKDGLVKRGQVLQSYIQFAGPSDVQF